MPLHCLLTARVSDGSLTQFDLRSFTSTLVFFLKTLRIFFLFLQGRNFNNAYPDGSFQPEALSFLCFERSYILSPCSSHSSETLLEGMEGELVRSFLSLFSSFSSIFTSCLSVLDYFFFQLYLPYY